MYYRGSIGWTLLGGVSAYIYVMVLLLREKIIEILSYAGFIFGIFIIISTILSAAIYFTMGFKKFRLSIRDIVTYLKEKILRRKGKIKY